VLLFVLAQNLLRGAYWLEGGWENVTPSKGTSNSLTVHANWAEPVVAVAACPAGLAPDLPLAEAAACATKTLALNSS